LNITFHCHRTWNGQFCDDGAEVELQVPIPVEMEGSDGPTTVNAQHMQVDTQDRTLSTTVQTSQMDNSFSQHHALMVG
jgi:hypothetical protein